jgi:diguanylate cyclase (GGDEF)-like protein
MFAVLLKSAHRMTPVRMRKMSRKSPIIVQISLEDASLADHWRDALAANELFETPSEVTGERASRPLGRKRPPHILVVPIDSASDPTRQELLARHDRGVVFVGDAAAIGFSQDRLARNAIVLSVEATAREIVLACRLLGENVRLRRRALRERRDRQRLQRLADTDPLTGLLNRRAWQRALHARLRDAATTGMVHCLAVFDLDCFKQINDTRGYSAGDQVLMQVANALRQGVRSGDAVARLGGDEFGVLLANITKDAAATVVERLRQRAKSRAESSDDAVTASAGYVCFSPRRELDEALIVEAADQALRAAKAAGRNRAVAAPTF